MSTPRGERHTRPLILPDEGIGYEAGTVGIAIDQRLRLAFTCAPPINATTTAGISACRQTPDGWQIQRETLSPTCIAAGGLSHGTAMRVAVGQSQTTHHAWIYGMTLDAHTLYSALTRDQISAHLYLPRTVLESEADQLRYGEPRSRAEEIERADSFLTPEPEPIAAPAPIVSGQARIDAERTERENAAVVQREAALLELARTPYGLGLLGEAALTQRVNDLAAKATTASVALTTANAHLRQVREHGGGSAETQIGQRRAELAEQVGRITHARQTEDRLQRARAIATDGRHRIDRLRGQIRLAETELAGLSRWRPSIGPGAPSPLIPERPRRRQELQPLASEVKT
ncbi:hypothetical protein ACQPYK_49175 (plasmid) [Streptosporangium sp. CA-135522]|uniref:hypothetical protein n=1 Tax=Streptosporangium sp. CA-135522 TaxID=3240072 RepID=UPI003D8CB6D1